MIVAELTTGGCMSITVAPERPFGDLSRQMGKLIEQIQKGYSNFAPGEMWSPSVNLYETERAYLVCVDLAGVDKEKIEILVEGHILRLHGRREVPAPDGDGGTGRLRVHLMEIDHGAFSRDVELPEDVRQESISAQYA